jgi:Uncharacterized low-complexity proteins
MQQTKADRAVFNKAVMTAADLTGSSMEIAQFVETDLRFAKLSYGNFTRADFSKADLQNAQMVGAKLFFTNFHLIKDKNLQLDGTNRLSGAMETDIERYQGEEFKPEEQPNGLS